MAVFPRICVSATGGGAGKTMLALGLGRAWRDRGRTVLPFKKGPDYIDAAWLAVACSQPATNLDPWFLPVDDLCHLFISNMMLHSDSIALVEGNRGLYDGLNETGSCSTAQVARAIDCPILLCIDCSKVSRTVAAILHGLITFETGLRFAGVILNRIGSPRHESSVRRAIEANTDLPVLGAIPRLAANLLPERHMGLASFGRSLNENIEQILSELAALVCSHCDVDAILEATLAAPPFKCAAVEAVPTIIKKSRSAPAIGFVRDDALWFYYQENLVALEQAGANLREISLFSDTQTWADLDGIYLGGGFPEDFCEQISNSPQLQKLADCAARGMPIYAECGGLIVLCAGIERENKFFPMANVFDATVEWLPRPQGLGYVEAKVVGTNPFYPIGYVLRGHEFHYSRLKLASGPFALELVRGAGIWRDSHGMAYDGIVHNNVWGSYLHIFAPAVPCWAPAFTAMASTWRRSR